MSDPIQLELDRSLAAHKAIVKAIVCLNFGEPEAARDVLLVALSNFNFNDSSTVTFTAAKEAA